MSGMSDNLANNLKMSATDRMISDNQTGMRMKQAQQLLKVAAEVALLAATSGASGALGKVAGGVGKAGAAVGKTIAKESLKKGIEKGAEFVGKQILGKVKEEAKKQFPVAPEVKQGLELKGKIDDVRGILNSFEGAITGGSNGKINAASKVLLGKADLTHGAVGYANKVVGEVEKGTKRLQVINENQKASVELVKTFFAHDGKTALLANKTPEEIMNKKFLASANLTNGKEAIKIAENYSAVNSLNKLRIADLQTQLTKGGEQLDHMIGQTTMDLLKDTKAILESAEEDAEADDRSEADIRRMSKA